jgi:hypothetical protein
MDVILTQPVEFALRTLGDEDRQTVLAWLDHLKDWENDPGVRRHSHKLASADNVYVLQTSTDIRIFFAPEKDRIMVLDVAKKAAILSSGHMAGHGGS